MKKSSLAEFEVDENIENKRNDEIRPFSLYGILTCGIIIFIIGLYMFFTKISSNGMVLAKYGGRHGTGTINGIGAIILGLGICIFPIYQLIKQRKK